MAVNGSGGPPDRPRQADLPPAAEPPAAPAVRPGVPPAGLDQEVSDHEMAALEQAVDLFQQRLSAQQTPFEPLALSWPEFDGAVASPLPGLTPHPEVVEPPRRDS